VPQKTKPAIRKKRFRQRLNSAAQESSFKPHHAKPFRRRHLSLAGLFILGSCLTLLAFIYIVLANSAAAKSARSLLQNTFQTPQPSTQSAQSTIKSSYGFSLSFSNQELSAGAIDTSANKFYIGPELGTTRAYDTIRLSLDARGSTEANSASAAGEQLNLQYYLQNPLNGSQDLQSAEQKLVAAKNPNFKLGATNSEEIAGQQFLISQWQFTSAKDQVLANLQASFTSYLTFYQNLPLLITVNNGLSSSPNTELNQVVRSIKFSSAQTSTANPQLSLVGSTEPEDLNNSKETNQSLLDLLMFTKQVSAAKPEAPSSTEKVAILYSPAVVRIYNFFCMDITKNGQEYLKDYCQASTGSGFFVGSEGYIATNGHVAVNEPLDLAILYALNAYSEGNDSYLQDLINLSGLSEADLLGAKNDQEKSNIIFKALSKIPKNTFQATNPTINLLAATGQKQPDTESLAELTKNHQLYTEQDGIKNLSLVASDYRAVDGYYTGQFESSDVALLKVENSNSSYPAVKLGNIQSLFQGGSVSILGYPGAASSNGLVSQNSSSPTLTSGTISSIKNAIGSPNKLIETDATIGHGNSGGPAFNSSAEVIGIATYTVDGSGQGDGVFNYIRDITDLTELAKNSSINVSASSPLQSEWQEGVELFYHAHYTKAIQHFQHVQDLYPQHPKAAELISLARSRIESGQEAKDSPWFLLILAGLFILGTLLSLNLIIRHRHHHRAYLKSLQLQTPPIQTPPPNLHPQIASPVFQSPSSDTNKPQQQ
jgi:S1-C subfamily serine protease